MASGTLTPTPYQTILDSTGVAVSGAKIYTYIAGTTTPVATYTDAALSIANANPIIADSAGRYVAFLVPGSSYKFAIQDAAGVAIRTQDNIVAVPGSSTSVDVVGTAGEPLAAGKVVYLAQGGGGIGRWLLADAGGVDFSTNPEIGMTVEAIATGATGLIRVNGLMTDLSGLTAGTTYYVGTAGALTGTRPVNARVVGVADSTTTLVLDPYRSDLSPVIQITTLTGAQNDFALTPGTKVLRLNNATLLTLSGFAAGYDGQRVDLVSVGAGQVDLVYQSGASAAANRIITTVTSGNTSLAPGTGTAVIVYDATTTRWRLILHEQGAWITPAYGTGAEYTAATGTWGVEVGDVSVMKSWLKGRTMHVKIAILTSSVSATPTDLRRTIPGGFTSAGDTNSPIQVSNAGGAAAVGMAVATGTNILFYSSIAGGAWSIATNNTVVNGGFFFEVT